MMLTKTMIAAAPVLLALAAAAVPVAASAADQATCTAQWAAKVKTRTTGGQTQAQFMQTCVTTRNSTVKGTDTNMTGQKG